MGELLVYQRVKYGIPSRDYYRSNLDRVDGFDARSFSGDTVRKKVPGKQATSSQCIHNRDFRIFACCFCFGFCLNLVRMKLPKGRFNHVESSN